jgi:hypothetical protein
MTTYALNEIKIVSSSSNNLYIKINKSKLSDFDQTILVIWNAYIYSHRRPKVYEAHPPHFGWSLGQALFVNFKLVLCIIIVR